MPQISRPQRGHYATNACTNCRKKHTKCSEEIICAYCASHNLKCSYVNPVKKRGPKAANRPTNVFESNFSETANINVEQEHTLTLTEYQFGVPIPFYLNYNYNEPFQPIQTNYFSHTDDNAPANFGNIFSLSNNFPSSFFLHN
ncbi:ZnII2Cys6 transcription factor [Gigaspora margarita]|uniref:ZnII2Cys6 transcription factor n=1 Tax=Gigaspora margarita TaxID=4874 RepID=A0A8H4AVG6_GIGMA|nr:ZnII2Cys6 transcription factor [Gigaspora margarita]